MTTADRSAIAERFYGFVREKAPPARCRSIGPCWIWTGALSPKGYGWFWCEGKKRKTHMVAWWLNNGRWPGPKQQLLHRCDRPACVRPGHLRIGTNHQNVLDAIRKGRR